MFLTLKVYIPNLGERAVKAREKLGLSQDDIAERSNVSLQMIRFIEQGRRGMSEETLRSLCKAYEVSPSTFLEGVDLLID